jgi:outer membrane protein assembly factor BamB
LGDAVSRWIYSAPVVDDGVLYVGSSAFFAALEAATGKVLWTSSPGRDWISSYSSPTVGDGRVLLGSMWLDRRSLFALDAKTGKTAWRAPAVGLHGSAALDEGKVYYADARSNLHGVDVAGGTEEKTVELGEGWSACTPALGQQVIVVSDGTGKVLALERPSLEVRWEKQLDRSLYQMSPYQRDWEGITSSPTLSGDLVYIGGSDGWLYALDLRSGQTLWKHAFGVPVLSTPTVTGNLLLVGSYDGRVHAFAGEVDTEATN